jgi:hypothetical protein
MRARPIAIAVGTFAVVALAFTFGMGHLLQVCAYQLNSTPCANGICRATLCGMGVCGTAMTCSTWAPALFLGPLVGLVAGLEALILTRGMSGGATRATS